MLYRSQSLRHLPNRIGSFPNPNLKRERKPRDTSLVLHKAFGEWFTFKFGINYRSKALFCTGNIEIARGYLDGHSALIELQPMGEYSICFSPNCKDLLGHFQFGGRNAPENLPNVGNELDQLGFIEYKNSGLEEAAESGNEVMIFSEAFFYKRLS